MKIMCEQEWFFVSNELPNKDEVVLAYNGSEFEVYHFIDCFTPDIDMWCRLPDFWRLKIGLNTSGTLYLNNEDGSLSHSKV